MENINREGLRVTALRCWKLAVVHSFVKMENTVKERVDHISNDSNEYPTFENIMLY